MIFALLFATCTSYSLFLRAVCLTVTFLSFHWLSTQESNCSFSVHVSPNVLLEHSQLNMTLCVDSRMFVCTANLPAWTDSRTPKPPLLSRNPANQMSSAYFLGILWDPQRVSHSMVQASPSHRILFTCTGEAKSQRPSPSSLNRRLSPRGTVRVPTPHPPHRSPACWALPMQAQNSGQGFLCHLKTLPADYKPPKGRAHPFSWSPSLTA